MAADPLSNSELAAWPALISAHRRQRVAGIQACCLGERDSVLEVPHPPRMRKPVTLSLPGSPHSSHRFSISPTNSNWVKVGSRP